MHDPFRDPWPVSPRAPWRWVIVSAAILPGAIGIPLLVCSWLCLPAADHLLLASVFVAVVSLVASGAGMVTALVRPRSGARVFVWGCSGLVVAVLIVALAHRVRLHALVACTERAQPLLDAIVAYERHRGVPPPSLLALIPDYLPALPATGVRDPHEFTYERWPLGRSPSLPAWEVSLSSAQLMDVDVLFYWPGEGYSERRQGCAIVERGSWGHVRVD